MRKMRSVAAALTAVATAAVAVPVMADPIPELYTYETQAREIETWNILYSQSAGDLNVLTNLYDGLVEADKYGKLVPAIAESWGTEDNGKTWTFHIREGVKWVDANGNEKGEVTAHDFVTGLEWVLNFHKNDAANTSMPMEMIAGAEEYYQYTNAMEDVDAALALTSESPEFADVVGIKAIDDYTLEYTCITEKPYFDTVATYNCLYPVPQAMIDELTIDGFKAASPETIWYNGAYTCTEYIQYNTKTLTKNEAYWDTECQRFDNVVIKMVESLEVAYQLYTTGEIDHVALSESNLTMIYNDEGHEFHDELVEARPTKYSYLFHFNYDKQNDDQTPDTNWNTAVANEAFRKVWYYGLDMGNYYKRFNAINPYKCYNNSYTMKGLVYTSDGKEYTDIVQEKLGYEPSTGDGMNRLDAEKAAQYKAQAIEELTAKGVEFPVHARYFIAGGNQNALDTAKVLQQTFKECFGDDFIVLDIDTYVNSLAKEVRTPRRQSFVLNGWGADYGDPQNFLGQETNDSDNAYYMNAYSHGKDNEDPDLKVLYDEYTALVNKADAITDDLDARYMAYAEAEAYMIEHALCVPAYFDVQWELTKINDYSKINAIFGIQNYKYKNWETSTDAYTAEDYAAFAEAWQNGSAE